MYVETSYTKHPFHHWFMVFLLLFALIVDCLIAEKGVGVSISSHATKMASLSSVPSTPKMQFPSSLVVEGVHCVEAGDGDALLVTPQLSQNIGEFIQLVFLFSIKLKMYIFWWMDTC